MTVANASDRLIVPYMALSFKRCHLTKRTCVRVVKGKCLSSTKYDMILMMDVETKVDILGGAAQFDLCATAGRPMPRGKDITRHISHVQPSQGRPVPVLKVLQTNACAKDCFYCPFRAGRKFRREAFKPEELADLTANMNLMAICT